MTQENDYTIIGIDGGGTKTRGILYRQNKIIAQSNSGTTRVGTVGVGESCERLLNLISDLCTQAQIDSEELDAVVIGLAGVWLDEEKKRSNQLLKTLARSQKITMNDLIIMSDAELALEGAFDGGNGIIMIAGTGSIAVGKLQKDKMVRCGGWGIELDDEGSGAWIGREGLTAIVRAIDGRGKPTILSDIFAELFPTINMERPRTIVKAYSERTFEYHMLTPYVMKCAVDKDEVCLEIINRACFHLMELLEVLQNQYKTQTVPVALMGGIIENNTLLAELLFNRLDGHKKLKRVNPMGSALDGSISIGMKKIKEMD